MNTRKHDLDQLEERLKTHKSKSAREQLESVHRQSKDGRLEELRKKFIEATKRGDLVTANAYERMLINYGGDK